MRSINVIHESFKLSPRTSWRSRYPRLRFCDGAMLKIVLFFAATGCFGCSNIVAVTMSSSDYVVTVGETPEAARAKAKTPTFASEDAARFITPEFEMMVVERGQSVLVLFQPRHGLQMAPFMIEEKGEDYRIIAKLLAEPSNDTQVGIEVSMLVMFHLNDILKDAATRMKSVDGGSACVLAEWIFDGRDFPFRMESLKSGQLCWGRTTVTEEGLKALRRICNLSSEPATSERTRDKGEVDGHQ